MKNQVKDEYGITSVQKVTKDEAFKIFGIQSIELPKDSNGKLRVIKNGFCGNVEVNLVSGIILSMALMASKRDDSGVYIMPAHSSTPQVGGTYRHDLTPVGNTYKFTTRDGTAAYRASTHIPKGMWDLLVQHIKQETKDMAIENLAPVAQPAAGQGSGQAAL